MPGNDSDLLGDLVRVFQEADEVVVCDICPASEEGILAVTAEALCGQMRDSGDPSVRYVHGRADLAAAVAPSLQEGDIFMTPGAGDISQVGQEVLGLLCAGVGKPS